VGYGVVSLELRNWIGADTFASLAADRLLLGQSPPDDVRIEEGPNGAFAATLDIAMWQKRIRAVGSVSVEFIASGEYFVLLLPPSSLPLPMRKSN
jgi:hypothetical protein